MFRNEAFVYAVVGVCIIASCLTSNLTYGQAQPNEDRPTVKVFLRCEVASQIIPGSFNGSGFPPNIHVGIVIDKTNETALNASIASPIQGLHNDVTDFQGNISGEFNVDTRIGSYTDHSLRLFSDTNRDDLPDSDFEQSISPIEC